MLAVALLLGLAAPAAQDAVRELEPPAPSEARLAAAAASQRGRALPASSRRVSPTGLDRVLREARANRQELEAALAHFAAEQAWTRQHALEYLVAHLARHGYARMAWVDAAGEVVDLDPSAFHSPAAFEAARTRLEATRGPLQARVVRFEGDALSVTEEELVRNVALAYQAWKEKPWARDVGLRVFLEGILPHRVGNEPLDDWRRILLHTFDGIEERLDDAADPAQAAAWIRRSVRTWVALAPEWVWHLSDQSLTEMLTSRRGRVEDLAHLEVLALRANAVPAALDYVPAWAARGGNHAWSALLTPGASGENAPVNRVAKVWRRTYAAQPDSWAAQVPAGARLPTWLADAHVRDVTDEYVATADAAVPLTEGRAEDALVYACVWDGRAWAPVDAGTLHPTDRAAADPAAGAAAGFAAGPAVGPAREARFRSLGREVVYLPARYDGDGLHPAGPPFLLGADGRVRVLDGLGCETPGRLMAVDRLAPAHPGEWGVAATPPIPLEAGVAYRLEVWQEGGWTPVDQRRGRAGATWWEVPPRRLVRLQAVAGEASSAARPFTPTGTGPRWW